MHVREKPPLRVHWQALTPAGRAYRWGEDEPDPANVSGGVSFSTTMPGGYEQASLTLPRKPARDYPDLDRLTVLTAYGAGGEVAWQGRLERAPRVSGDQMAVSPAAVGWQAHLEDDKSAKMVYRDVDLTRWQGPSRGRSAVLTSATFKSGRAPELTPDPALPSLKNRWDRLAQSPGGADYIEGWYDAAGVDLGAVYYDYDMVAGVGVGWVNQAHLSTDDVASSLQSGSVHTTVDAAATLTASAAGYKFALLQAYFGGAATADGVWETAWRRVAVYGRHGLTLRGVEPDAGFYASDIVEHAVEAFAPLLATDIQQSQYIVKQSVFLEPTTAGEIVRQTTRFGLQDWAVWDGPARPTFYWHNRGQRGRSWRMRIAPAQLEEAGESVERLYESVIVQYQDVDGSTITVGPEGSGADTEDDRLVDDDPENPAAQLGITKRALLTTGVMGDPDDAIEIGARFLEEQKQLDASGSATLVGHVEDDRGVLHAAWKVKAGDTITFVDAADPSPRRIVRTSYDHGARTCSVDIDAPPEGLQALLERLGADLIPVGL